MSLASDQNSDSLGDSGLQLFIQLVNTDSIAKVENVILHCFLIQLPLSVSGLF
jgi:hypothetical protein